MGCSAMKKHRSPFLVDLSTSKRAKTLQTEVVDVLRWLDELASALASIPAFEGMPLDHVLESIVAAPSGRTLSPGVRSVARQLRARWLNRRPSPHPYLFRDARQVGRQLLADLRVNEVGAQELVEALARERLN